MTNPTGFLIAIDEAITLIAQSVGQTVGMTADDTVHTVKEKFDAHGMRFKVAVVQPEREAYVILVKDGMVEDMHYITHREDGSYIRVELDHTTIERMRNQLWHLNEPNGKSSEERLH